MLVTLAVLAAVGFVGAALVFAGPAGPSSSGKVPRLRRVLFVIGAAMLSTFTVLVVTGALAWVFATQVGNALEDAFSTDTDESITDYQEPDSTSPTSADDGPSFGANNEILPETEDEWEQFCAPSSGISQENRDLYC